MSEAYCPPPPKGIGEYTTEELQQELASRDQFLGDFSMEVGGEHFVDHVKVAIKNECRYRGIPMLDDMQIGVVITSLRNHSYAMLMTRYDRRERFDLTKVTDFYPIESSVGRFLRDAGNELIDRAEAAKSVSNDQTSLQKGGSDTDVTTTAVEVLRKKMQFSHYGCPADKVVNGYGDLEKCTCGIDSQIKDSIATIKQLVLDALPKKLDVDDMRSWEDGHHRAGRNAGINECRQALEKVMLGKQ